MCSPDAPDPPDPVATAQAQNQVNKDALLTAARLNQITQNNPFGSVNYSGSFGRDLTNNENMLLQAGKMTQAEADAIRNGNRQQDVTLNPEIQKFLDTQIGISQGLSDKSLGRMAQITDAPFTLDGKPAVRTAGDAPQLTTNAGLATSFDAAGRQQMGVADVGGPQRSLNQLPLDQQIQNAADAVYNAQTRYVDDDFNRQQDRLGAQLAAKGIPEGSQAWNEAMGQLSRAKEEALQSARNAATTQGFNVQQGLFGQNLASAQFGNDAQQSAFAQELAKGNFYNTAQTEQNRQNREQTAFGNDARLQGANFSNDALARMFGMSLDQQQADQSMRSQAINEDILQRNQGFNELAAFLNGSPIAPSNPTFQPFSQSTAAQAAPDAVGLAGSNYRAATAANSGILGGLFGAAGQLGSAAIGACWVAREVYGAENPRWIDFRNWLLTKAPVWFRTLYLKYGERFAGFIRNKPRLKAVIRRWMEARLG